MLLYGQVGALFQNGVLQQLSLVKLHQLIKLLFRDHQDFIHGAVGEWVKGYTCLALYAGVVGCKRGRHEVDRCKLNRIPHTHRPVPRIDGVGSHHSRSDFEVSCSSCTAYRSCFAKWSWHFHDAFSTRRIGGWLRRAASSCVGDLLKTLTKRFQPFPKPTPTLREQHLTTSLDGVFASC